MAATIRITCVCQQKPWSIPKRTSSMWRTVMAITASSSSTPTPENTNGIGAPTNPGPYNPSAPPAKQFRNPVHCVALANDGLLYVCDRTADRIQVFKTDGTFVKEVFVAKQTLGDGSAFDIAFSKDPQQKYFYLADGSNMKIRVFDRASMTELTTFGDGGRQPGEFYAVHSIDT